MTDSPLQDIQSVRARVEFFQTRKESGWGVARIRAGAKKYIAVGDWPDEVLNEDIVELVGTVINHPQYGEQFALTRVVAHYPARQDAIQEWLEMRLPNIGPERAQEIVRKFGVGLWDVIAERPERLQEIKGLTEARVAEIVVAYNQHAFERDLIVKLLALGLNGRQATAAVKRWAKDTLPRLQDDPYCLFLSGVADFILVDSIAVKDYQVQRTDPRRICALLRSMLDEDLAKGNTTAIRHTMLYQLSRKLDLPQPVVEEILQKTPNVPFVLAAKNVSALSAYEAECRIAARVKNLVEAWS